MRPEQCDRCPLLFCDFVSPECRLPTKDVARLRPDMIAGFVRLPTKGVTRTDYWRNRKCNERGEIAVMRFAQNPNGVFARRRMRRLERMKCKI